MIDANKNWNRLDDETKQKVVTSYMGIQNQKLRKDIEYLYGYDNLNSYNTQKYIKETDNDI